MNFSPAAFTRAQAATKSAPPLRVPRFAARAAFSVAALALCVADAIAVSRNTPHSAAIGYTCSSIALLGCAAAFLRHARCTSGLLRSRWIVMVAALLAVSAGFAECTAALVDANAVIKPLQVSLFTAGEVLYLLAIVLFFSGVSRSIAMIDMTQALLLAVLRFSLTYTTATSDHFTTYHLYISQVFALVLFLTASIAVMGSTSEPERKFLRLLAWFFGLRFIAFFCSDQVSYTWLHNTYCSAWDIPFTAFTASFAVYLVWMNRLSAQRVPHYAQTHRPSLVVRSLMPSLLALANLSLALMVLRFSMSGATLAILFTALAYVARTTLLQSHAYRESAQLKNRNEQLEGLATHDHLTGIGNRRSLAALYANLQSQRGDTGLALLLMDIDHFKRANDLNGHLYGDEVLIALAKTLEAIGSRVPGSHCARFGGDEFALLLPGVSPDQAQVLAEDVRSTFAGREFMMGKFVPDKFIPDQRAVSISLGVYLLDAARRLPLEAVIAFADAALYRAKTLGRDRVEVYAAHQSDVQHGRTIGSGERMALQRAG